MPYELPLPGYTTQRMASSNSLINMINTTNNKMGACSVPEHGAGRTDHWTAIRCWVDKDKKTRGRFSTFYQISFGSCVKPKWPIYFCAIRCTANFPEG